MHTLSTPNPTSIHDADTLVADWSARDFRLVPVDLYRDIHKGLRAELFAMTESAGNADASCERDRAAVTDHVVSMAALLESHAHHEDLAIDPVLETHLPPLAELIAADHVAFESRFASIADLAGEFAQASPDRGARRLGQLLYLDLAGFVGDYLRHLDVEERVVMPAIEEAIGFDGVLDVHGAIVGSIPPDEMARSLAFMLPAMNADDRFEMLAGMRMGAPAEVFAGVVDLAQSVLRADQHRNLVARLGVH
jgi:hypothetical protein